MTTRYVVVVETLSAERLWLLVEELGRSFDFVTYDAGESRNASASLDDTATKLAELGAPEAAGRWAKAAEGQEVRIFACVSASHGPQAMVTAHPLNGIELRFVSGARDRAGLVERVASALGGRAEVFDDED